jgi:hypothetical protein
MWCMCCLSVSMHAAIQSFSIPRTLCHGCIPLLLRCARSAAVAQGRLLTGVASRLAEPKKGQGKDEGRNNKAASSPIFATAGSDARCVLCSRRFISKHALRIHLTRNANCRRKVHLCTLSTLQRGILTVVALRCTQLLILIREWSGADLIARTVLQHESASGKICMGRRADMEKHQFASLPGPCALPAPAGFRTILPTLPTLPNLPVSMPVMTLTGFQQQSEMKREVQGGGTNLSAKRSHLKRQLKVPTKLQGHHHHHHHQLQGKEREPNPGGENKIYKKGLFEKRFQQLVFLSPQPPIP